MPNSRFCCRLGFLVVFTFILLLGCTRETESTSSLKFQTSELSKKAGVLGYDQLTHIAINVTGPGLNYPIVFSWDARETGGNAPSSFELKVPQGSSRLIQVLAVYADSAAQSKMKFFYGDVTKALTSPNENAAVAVIGIGTGVITGGRLMGRYFSNPVSGPTGPIDIIFTPPGKPSMIVDRGAIFNGWFNLFGLMGAKFGYRLPDGSLLFNKSVELAEADFPASNSTMRAVVPLHQYQENQGGSTTWIVGEPEIFIYGFFGNSSAVAGKTVCRTGSPVFSKLAKSGDSMTLLTYSTAAVPADLNVPNLPSVYVSGGVDLASSPCTTPDPYISQLNFYPSLLENGNDNAAGFRGTFGLSGGNWISTSTVDANTKSISGALLPGISDVIDKFLVYKKVGAGEERSDYPACHSMGPKGYFLVGDRSISAGSMTFPTTNIPFTDSEKSIGTTFALCPSKNNLILGPGIWLRGDNFGGGSPPSTFFTKFQLAANQPINSVTIDNSGKVFALGGPGNTIYTSTDRENFSLQGPVPSVAAAIVSSPTGVYAYKIRSHQANSDLYVTLQAVQGGSTYRPVAMRLDSSTLTCNGQVGSTSLNVTDMGPAIISGTKLVFGGKQKNATSDYRYSSTHWDMNGLSGTYTSLTSDAPAPSNYPSDDGMQYLAKDTSGNVYSSGVFTYGSGGYDYDVFFRRWDFSASTWANSPTGLPPMRSLPACSVSPYARVPIAINSTDEKFVFVSCQGGGQPAQLYKSDGSNWNLIYQTPFSDVTVNDFQFLSGKLVAVGRKNSSVAFVMKSENNGINWQTIDEWQLSPGYSSQYQEMVSWGSQLIVVGVGSDSGGSNKGVVRVGNF